MIIQNKIPDGTSDEKVDRYNKFLIELPHAFYNLEKDNKLTPNFCEEIKKVYRVLKNQKDAIDAYSGEYNKSDSMYTSALMFNPGKIKELASNINKNKDLNNQANNQTSSEKELLSILPIIKNILYNTDYNNDREVLRERWLSKGREYNSGLEQLKKRDEKLKESGKNFIFFDVKKVEHLGSYLTRTDELIKIIENKLGDKAGSVFGMKKNIEFKNWLVTFISEDEEKNLEFLDQLFTTINLIPEFTKEHYKTDSIENQDKMRLVRALRFGSLKLNVIIDEVEKFKKEIYNDPNLRKLAGQLLKQKSQEFINLVKSSQNDDAKARRESLIKFLEDPLLDKNEEHYKSLESLIERYFPKPVTI